VDYSCEFPDSYDVFAFFNFDSLDFWHVSLVFRSKFTTYGCLTLACALPFQVCGKRPWGKWSRQEVTNRRKCHDANFSKSSGTATKARQRSEKRIETDSQWTAVFTCELLDSRKVVDLTGLTVISH
jgi:hypothetical protein